jgi:hypothetical protein
MRFQAHLTIMGDMGWNLKVRELTPRQLGIAEARMRDPKQNGGNVFLGRKEALLDVGAFDFETFRAVDVNPADFSKKVCQLVWDCQTAGASSERRVRARYGYTGDKVFDIDDLTLTEVDHRARMAFCPLGPPVTDVIFSAASGRLTWQTGEDDLKACEGIGDHGWGSSNIYIENRKLGRSTFLGDLLVHLMEAHEFYEGQGTKYRFDPLYNLYVLGMIEPKAYESFRAERERLHNPELA